MKKFMSITLMSILLGESDLTGCEQASDKSSEATVWKHKV